MSNPDRVPPPECYPVLSLLGRFWKAYPPSADELLLTLQGNLGTRAVNG